MKCFVKTIVYNDANIHDRMIDERQDTRVLIVANA